MIKDTAGIVTNFSLSQGPIHVRSFSYVFPWIEFIDCPPIQFSFYDIEGKDAGFTFIIPGQNFHPCVSFGPEVASYNGITLWNITIPEDLLLMGNIEAK
jgi:hypothetical protein